VSARNKFLIILAIIVVIAGIYYYFSVNHSSDLVLIGTVDANQVVVSAKITGRVEKLAVDEGSPVKAGDLIAELDTQELGAAAQAAKAQVAQTQATEALTKGTTTNDVTNAQAQAQAAHSQLVEAVANRDRVKTDNVRIVALANQGIASQQQKDQSEADLRGAEAHVRSAQDTAKAADAAVASAIARTHQQGAAQSTVAATAAQAREAEARLGYARVVSPVDGSISVLVARQGEVVMPGEAIVTIVDYTQTWVRAAVPETYSDAIQLGDTLTVVMPSGARVPGKVIVKQAEADFATQRDVSRTKRDIKAIGLKLLIDNPGAKYTTGMTATVLVPQSKLEAK
jgi:multidrug resistance efflux pump